VVSALTPIADFNEETGAAFSDEEFDTVGGMVTAEFGHLPEVGEETAIGGFLFHVTEADDRRVQEFRVSRLHGES
jgi:magnesium and cobalt transporter